MAKDLYIYKDKESFLKRSFDVAFSFIMMVLSLPVSIPIAIAIKMEDGGQVFYRQERWGRNGRRFYAYKFRTMVSDSDKKFGIRQAEENDSRITRVGGLLRATGLDELPQIINIFSGEMSFVGPRALAVGEIIRDEKGNVVDYEDFPEFYERLKVKPGLTSPATIYFPKDTFPQKKFRYDLLYIRKQSFRFDLRLIILSFLISLRGKWENRDGKI